MKAFRHVALSFAAAIALVPLCAPHLHAQEFAPRMRVDIADVVFRDGVPYDRDGHFRDGDRLVVLRDAYGRPVFYRDVPALRAVEARGGWSRTVGCDDRGRCGPDRAMDARWRDGR